MKAEKFNGPSFPPWVAAGTKTNEAILERIGKGKQKVGQWLGEN